MVYLVPPNGDFQADNPYWNGLKSEFETIEITKTKSLMDISPPYTDKVLMVIPYQEISTNDLKILDDFINDGGILILADDFGHGNLLLSQLGLEVRFANTPLLDPVICHTNRWLPIIVRFATDPVTADITELVFNHPTSLIGVSEQDVIAWSSSMSFSDANNNGKWDNGEEFGPYPVIARYHQGNGQLILISDPSVFINSNQNLGDNSILLGNIAGLGENGFFIDQSLLPSNELVLAQVLLHNLRQWLVTPTGTILLIIAVIGAVMMLLWPIRKI